MRDLRCQRSAYQPNGSHGSCRLPATLDHPLTLVDDSTSTHIIKNGTWVNGVAKPGKEPGAPTMDQTFNGNDSASIGPFKTPGTYHLYCTIHPEMNLTVIVE